MNETFDIGRLYLVRYDHCTKQFERAVSRESEPPYRVGRGVAVRVWKNRGLVLGFWGKPAPDIDTGLFNALGAREMSVRTEAIEGWGGVEKYTRK